MIPRGAAALAVLLFAFVAFPAGGQGNRPGGTLSSNFTSVARPSSASLAGAGNLQTKPAGPAASTAQPQAGLPEEPGTAAARSDCYGGNCDVPPPHIAISTPAPAPAPWLWQEKVSWGANLILVVLGYVAILMGLALLRKIERQGRYVEEASQAAAESAQAALKQADALARAERPWILMSIRPAQNIRDGFTVIATNRGRGPARVVSTVDNMVCAIDENHLEPEPVYKREPEVTADPIILLPGESTELVSFSRNDVKQVCETAERLKRVENWEERIYLYGKVTYRDLAAPDDAPLRESSWLSWYIHGRQKSGMVMTGLPAYNRHT